MGTSAPRPVVDLVERFERDRKACPERSRRVFLSADYKEEQLRAEFLNPFFESLGWDVSNKAGLTEVFKPVIHEESIKIAGATKAPDYTFRIGGFRDAADDSQPTAFGFGLRVVSRKPLALFAACACARWFLVPPFLSRPTPRRKRTASPVRNPVRNA